MFAPSMTVKIEIMIENRNLQLHDTTDSCKLIYSSSKMLLGYFGRAFRKDVGVGRGFDNVEVEAVKPTMLVVGKEKAHSII
jgi:hypothetical protein